MTSQYETCDTGPVDTNGPLSQTIYSFTNQVPFCKISIIKTMWSCNILATITLLGNAGYLPCLSLRHTVLH